MIQEDIETHGLLDYSIDYDLNALVGYAENVWNAGVTLSTTVPGTLEFACANNLLVHESSLLNYCKRLVESHLARFSQPTNDVSKILGLVDAGVSRYYVPGLYDPWFFSTNRLSTDGLESYECYVSCLHAKVKKLKMVQVDGVWTPSQTVRDFLPLEVPDAQL
jgi:hypothetical protein